MELLKVQELLIQPNVLKHSYTAAGSSAAESGAGSSAAGSAAGSTALSTNHGSGTSTSQTSSGNGAPSTTGTSHSLTLYQEKQDQFTSTWYVGI